ncbi:hypothetical protein R4Z09_19340 [Niallia oryzisoli]|uniref:Uncharacterized protein n=1 Tax=Niallia oryzisoli TaxID=1737571 RepID=A0ABZ2CEA0_9BACI
MSENQNQNPVDPTVASAITSIINSIATEENALTFMIAELAAEVNAVVGTNPTSLTTLTTVDNNVKRKLQLILKKNIVLEKKLRDAVNFFPNLTFLPGELAALITALNNVIGSVANEEAALADLIRAEAAKVSFVATHPTTFTASDLVTINNNVDSVIQLILDKNIVLEEKLEDVLRGFANLGITITNPTFGPLISSALASVITSIATEEASFGALISAEATKIGIITSGVTRGTNTPAQLSAVNASVENMLHDILNKNIILETKLKDVLDFLTPPTMI